MLFYTVVLLFLVGPTLLDLPPGVFDSMCVSLDSGTVHNWKQLVCHLKDYTMMDVRQLSTMEQKVRENNNCSVYLIKATFGEH